MAAGKSATPLCKQFGFDADWRQAQLALIGLTEDPRELALELHQQVLVDDVRRQIVDVFFAHLTTHEQAGRLIASFDPGHLKEKQIGYLETFGVGCREESYFESRARVGVAHARVGVPLGLYLASFGVIQELVLGAITDRVVDTEKRRQMVQMVLRLTTLDIALATEVYHRARIEDLGRSVKHLELEQEILREQIEQDALTSVSSRTSLLRELEGAIAKAGRTGQPLCVVMADLDHFKDVNDNHGHLVGDQVLKEVAARIKAALRAFDLVGRYGGEEFVLLLEDTSPHTAQQIAERIRLRISSEPIHTGECNLDITISQGLAVYREGEDSSMLLSRADKAMYRAKQAGRNCVSE